MHTHTDAHTHTHVAFDHSFFPPWEDQCEWHRMTRMTGPDYAVMCYELFQGVMMRLCLQQR